MRIGVNCGHTISGQPGCGAIGFIDESVETRRVGKSLMSMLSAAGHTVYDCTNDKANSTSENLNIIVAMANRQPLDLFVSIHFNAGGGRGTEVFTYGAQKHTAAVNVLNRMTALGFTNRGIKDGSNLAVVRRTNSKAMLIEVCFVDTQTDVAHYNNLGVDAIARAIFIGITGEEPESNTPTNSDDGGEEDMADLERRVADLEAKVAERTGYFNYIDNNMNKDYRPTIQKLVGKGILNGNEKGELMLTNDMMRILVILDREGVFG